MVFMASQFRQTHARRLLQSAQQHRWVSAQTNPPRPSRWRRWTLAGRHPLIRILWSGSVSVVVGGTIIMGGLLAWDATTYRDKHVDRVPLNPLCLQPKRGGKKDLPVAQVLIDDEESEEQKALLSKPKLVIVGGGWGSVSLLKHLKLDEYHVTVVSPENYFAFTPLMPSATVGTVEIRSLVEPLRKLVARVHGHFIQGKAVDIDVENRLLEVSNGKDSFYLPYDKAIIAVGSTSNTHGVPGLEHSFQLKTIPDIFGIRRRIMENLETAVLPTTSEEERQRLLSFVICGGGPTGIEFASEIYDMSACSLACVGIAYRRPVNEDVLKYFPKYLRASAKISVIQSRDHILNTYSEDISKYAEHKFLHNGIDTVLNARVKSISPRGIIYRQKESDGTLTEHVLPSGLVLWSTGIAMNPFTQQVASLLPNQYHKHALEVDSHLRVKGAPLGSLYALGDAATVETNLVDHLFEVFDASDLNKDGHIDFEEFEHMLKIIRRKFPSAQLHIEKVRDVFEAYDKDKNGLIGINEMGFMFQEISSKLTTLPATAQVASQQGTYLAKKFNALAQAKATETVEDVDDVVFNPFKYMHLGSLAYLGNSAVFDLGQNWSFAGGLLAMYAWRSVYWSEQVSLRTRVLLMVDWVKRGLFGRDFSKF